MEPGAVRIGGAPAVRLQARAEGASPAVTEALILPGRSMMLLQARVRLASGDTADILEAPDLAAAALQLDGGADDFAGNRAFAFGGALLAPYANRIRGRALPDSRDIETQIDGHAMRLPRNWGGKAPGAEQYAMHGLILDQPARWSQTADDAVTGVIDAGDFGGRWPGALRFTVAWRLQAGGLRLEILAEATGPAPAPVGLGWHPYLRILSGDRTQARLHLPARLRAEVNDYDEVLPTGRLLPADGPYDFRSPGGEPLGDLYLDDCFTGLERPGDLAVEVRDPAAGLGLRVLSDAPAVRAVQVYAPRDQAFVVVEPQFNLANPFGAVWPADVDTGMVRLEPGRTVRYAARLEPFPLGNSP